MKVLFFSLAIILSSSSLYAEGEKASRNIDCCHTGLCKTDVPLCPGVSRNPERRETNKKIFKKSSQSSRASEG